MVPPKRILFVKFYREPSGREPVREWLLKLDPKDRKIIGYDIKLVQEGWPIGMPLVGPLGNKLWEVRTDLDNRIARVIFMIDRSYMMLLNGFIKKSQKTPQAEIDLANKRAKNVMKA